MELYSIDGNVCALLWNSRYVGGARAKRKSVFFTCTAQRTFSLLRFQSFLFHAIVYNAPNPGSLKLRGQWWALGLNFSNEYQALEDAALDAEWEAKKSKLKERALSSFYGEVKSPFMSAHTQALYGLAAQHN